MQRPSIRQSLAALSALGLLIAPTFATGQLGPPILRGQPTVEDVQRAYPSRARAQHLGGTVILSCAVAVTGRLERCAVVSEKPEGEGFGVAALGLAGKFLMEPKMQGGRAVEGGRVRVPIVFALPDQAVMI
jgi:TonB family protein